MTGQLSWLVLATHVPASGRLGGMVRYVVELTAELHRRSDVRLSVLTTPSAAGFFAELLGSADRVLTVPPLPTTARSLLERPGWGVPAFRRPFDVVHGTKHLLPQAGGALKVLTVHDLLPMDRPQDFGVLKRRLLVPAYRASLRSAACLLCVSGATRDRLLADQPSVAERTSVVPLAVSTALRTATARPVPQLRGRSFALVVGDASPRKNLALVVSAWKRVVERRPDAMLVLIGPVGWGVEERGPHFDALVQAGAVVQLGGVDDAQLRWCYEHAAVVACPSLLEGFGLPALEALHFGAPLITSEDPALVEASGAAALHLPATDAPAWGDALVRLLSEPRGAPGWRTTRTWADVAEETVRAVRDRVP